MYTSFNAHFCYGGKSKVTHYEQRCYFYKHLTQHNKNKVNTMVSCTTQAYILVWIACLERMRYPDKRCSQRDAFTLAHIQADEFGCNSLKTVSILFFESSSYAYMRQLDQSLDEGT